MRKNRIRWAALLCAALALYISDNNAGTRIVLLAAALPPPLSALPLLVRPRVEVSLEAPMSVKRGLETVCRVTVENQGRSALCLRFAVEEENRFTGERAVERFTVNLDSRRRQTAVRELVLDTDHCGNLALAVTGLRATDPFGVFARRIRCEEAGSVLVQPEPCPIEVSLREAGESSAEAQRYASDRPGNDPSETFRIREYVPGDPLGRVHWKLSEKLDKTLVRDYGLPEADRVLLLFDAASPVLTAEEADLLADAFFSLSRALLADGVSHAVGWFADGALQTQRVTGDAELALLTVRLLGAPVRRGSAVERFLEEGDPSRLDHIAVVARETIPGLVTLPLEAIRAGTVRLTL